MGKRAWNDIPQIVAITRVSKDGKLGLKKAVRHTKPDRSACPCDNSSLPLKR